MASEVIVIDQAKDVAVIDRKPDVIVVKPRPGTPPWRQPRPPRGPQRPA